MGDLDGDGEYSLFVRTGSVNPESGALKRSTHVACVNPYE